MNCLTIIYPAGSGLTFNADYYRDHHLKTIMKLYGPSIQRFELRKVAAPQAAYAAAVNIWISDLDAFKANNDKHGKTLQDDVPNCTNGAPVDPVRQGARRDGREAQRAEGRRHVPHHPLPEQRGRALGCGLLQERPHAADHEAVRRKSHQAFRAAQGRRRHGAQQQA